MAENTKLLIEEIDQLERALEMAEAAHAELRASLDEVKRQRDAAIEKLQVWERLLEAQDRELKSWRNGTKSFAATRVEERLAASGSVSGRG